MTLKSTIECQLSTKPKVGCGSGRDSRSRLAALPRRCELEVSVRPEAARENTKEPVAGASAELEELSDGALTWPENSLSNSVITSKLTA